METSFTHFLKSKWRIYIPILFFVVFGLTKGQAADCGIDIDDISFVIDCEGGLAISIVGKDVKSFTFVADGSITTFDESPIVHATKIFDNEGNFTLEIICSNDDYSKVEGSLPDFDANGAGTYVYSAAGVVSGPTAVPSGGTLTLSSSTVNPTCASGNPNDMDGSISITVNGNIGTKCKDVAMITVTVDGVDKIVKVGETATFTNLGAGDYTASATVDDSGCPCAVAAVATLTQIPLRGPTSGTTSLACNAQINVSVSQSCEATIMVADMLRGVSDPCNPMIAMIDSIVVKSGGIVVAGSGGTGSLGVVIPNADGLLGKPLTVEVIDEDSGNLCWGTVVLEDKSPPIVTCNDPGLMEILCLDYNGDVMSTIDELVEDCSEVTTTIIAQSDINDCDRLDQGILRRVEVTYFAEDEFGNRSNICTDTLDVLRFDTVPGNGVLDVPGHIIMPSQFALDPKQTAVDQTIDGNRVVWPVDSLPLTCTGNYARLYPDDPDNPAPAPISIAEGGTGSPILIFINSKGEVDTSLLAALNYKNADNAYKTIINRNLANCNIGADFEDLIFDFGCKVKIQRQWYLREWSCPISQGGDEEQKLNLGVQEIIVTDLVAPEIAGPVADMTFTVDAEQCSRFVNIPKPVIEDECTANEDLLLEVAIYDMDGNLIGPGSTSGVPNMFYDFPTGMSFVVYTVFDDCGNRATDTTKVTVMDDTPPVVICKEFLVIGISGDGDVRLPVTSIDNGTYDQCDLDRICVTRMDDLDLLQSLDTNNDGELLFSIFDDSCQARAASGDGCYRDYSSSSYERDGKFYISNETICTPYVDFCCADVNNQGEDGLMVELRAYDTGGNVNRCMTFVELQDKNPAIVTCPPNITIDCNFDLPSYDATYDDIANDPLAQYFGSIVPQGQQKSFGIPDEFVIGGFTDDLVDGTIFDNCSIPTISVKITTNINSCNSGRIIRELFSDETGSAVRICRQVITIQRNSLLIDSVLFADIKDVTLEGCMTPEELINESFGTPNIDDAGGKCSQLAVSTENQLFLFNTQDQESDACFKVVRTFTVIDWCQSTAGNPFVVGTHTQIIKVNDPEGPTLTCSDDLTGANSVEVADCNGGEVMLMATAFDECTEATEHRWTGRIELDLDGNGTFETFDNDIIIISNPTGEKTSKAVHTGTYPLGTHRITWTVADRCGNIQSCVQNFTIVNTKKPTPFAIDISTVLMNTGPMVEVWAADLDNGKSVGPCGQALSMSIVRLSDVGNRSDGGFGISQAALTFTCNDVGADGVDVNYFVYYDGGGESIFDFTTVNIKVQDNNNVCNSVTSAFVSGNIHNENKESLPNITVDIKSMDGTSATLESSMTNDRGDYAFPAMPQGGSYSIDPTSSDDYLNGVSTLDLVLIQRYILGISKFDSPYKILAADINNDRSITAIDLVDLRSVILGYKESFTNNESWRFIDENYDFFDPEYPLDDNLAEAYDINSLVANMSIDFIGFKVGDVNGTVDAASIVAGSRSNYNLVTEDRSFTPGETVKVSFKASDVINTLGMQMSIAFNADALAFTGIDAQGLAIGREHIGYTKATEGAIAISWSDVAAQSLTTGEELFTLQFRAKSSGTISDMVAIENATYNSEIYNEQLDIAQLGLVFNEDAVSGEFVLQQNVPNPFAENTLISFYLPNAAEATLTITDLTGRTIKNYTGSFDKGNNYISVRADELAVSGVLFYTVATENFTDTKRMVVLK